MQCLLFSLWFLRKYFLDKLNNMSYCSIQFDNSQVTYYPGSTVKGKLICFFDEAKAIRDIQLKLRGIEHNEWSGPKGGRPNRRAYKGHNKFLTLQTTLRGAGYLVAGRHEYPFSFTLPRDIPGSYYGSFGWIKFTVKATVARGLAMNYKDEVEFVVISLVDLNTMSDELSVGPPAYSGKKMLYCCCCASGPITMNVYLERDSYVPGETVKFKVEITNLSRESIQRVDVKLGKTIESKVKSPATDRKYEKELLAATSETGVGAHGERTYTFELEIPRSTSVPNFNLCTLFKLTTKLKVIAVLSRSHMSLSVSAPIIMGHIPVGGQFQNVILQQIAYPYPTQQQNYFPNEDMEIWDSHIPTYLPEGNTGVDPTGVLYSPSCPSISGSVVPQPPAYNFASATSRTSRPTLPSVHKPHAPAIPDDPSTSSAPPPSYDEAIALPHYPPK